MTAWPVDQLDRTPNRYIRALSDAMRVVGVQYHPLDIPASRSISAMDFGRDYGTKLGDWTWAEVAHEFLGFMGVPSAFLSLFDYVGSDTMADV